MKNKNLIIHEENQKGRVLPPLLLYLFGLPLGLCLVLWFLFFRG